LSVPYNIYRKYSSHFPSLALARIDLSMTAEAADPSDARRAAVPKTAILWRRLRRGLLSAAGIGALAWGAVTAYGAWFAPAPPARPAGARSAPPVTVDTALVARGEFPVTLVGLGTVVPVATSVVKSQISGQLQQIHFRESQLVKAGDALAQVDPRPYRLALSQAEGQYQKDLALLQNAERDLKRYESLRSQMKDAISEQQIDTQRALIGQYRGVVAVDQAQVDQARLNLDYTRIVSPIDGRIGLRPVDPGNYVQANDANGVAVVTQIAPITVVFTLPSSELQPVLKRFRAGEDLPVIAYDNDRAHPLGEGRLVAIDNQIDAGTGTVKLRALFPNADERLYPNLFVNAELLVDRLKAVTLAPAEAVQRGAKGAFAYVVGADRAVVTRSLTLGPANGGRVVILDGLREGERVVTQGVDRLRDGATVNLPEPRKAESAPRPREKDGAS
jgi:membrane fusion protein, multidrug efflux system